MTPYGIVYKDTVSAFNEGAEIWRKKSGFINKKYFIMTWILMSLSVVVINMIIFYFRKDKDVYSTATLLITIMEIVSLFFALNSNLKRKTKSLFGTSGTKGLKQALLRENDIEFSTPYSKSNYFYEEIDSVIEGVNSINIIVEKGNIPVCVSKSGVIKGDIESFILVLKEKVNDRYLYENITGGKSV